MDPLTYQLILLAIQETPVVFNAAYDLIQKAKAGEPTKADFDAFLAVKHPDYAELINAAKLRAPK